MIVSIFTVSLNVIEYKSNVISLTTEIPAMLLIILSVVYLAYINTVDKSYGLKILYFSSSAILILIYRIMYQGDIYKIANKRDDFLLWYYGRKFFKITYWVYLLFFLLLIFGVINSANPVTDFCLRIVSWILDIKIIGWLIPWVAGLMVIGSINIALFSSLALIVKKNKSMTHQA